MKSLKQKIQEKFEFPDNSFSSWCSDLYVLTDNQEVREFAAENGFKSAYFTHSDVTGQSWHGKTFLEIPFANLQEITYVSYSKSNKTRR